MTLQQPLFMQAGKYTAAADRYLIGAMLYPKGGTDQNPRPGIRPFGTVDAADNTTEMSFRVDRPTGSGFTVGDVIVDEGVAFVAGPASQTLNGVYLVVNSGPQTVNMIGTGAGARIVELYLQILDAEHGGVPPLDPSTATAVFVTRDTSDPGSAVPMDALLLGAISLDAGGAVGTITDKRVYTTMHGGTVIVAAETELQAPPMNTLPLGFTAYSLAEMATYTRTLNGWETVSVLHVAKDRPQDAKVPSGYQFFDTDTGTLELFIRSISGSTATAAWYTMGRADGRVKLGTADATYPAGNFRHAQYTTGPFSVQATASVQANAPGSSYVTIDSGALATVAHGAGGPTINKPSKDSLGIRFLVLGQKTIVTAVLSMELFTRRTDYVYEENAWGHVILNLRKYSSPGLGGLGDPVTTNNNAIDYNLDSTGNPWFKAGLRSAHRQDGMKSRTIVYQLNPGEYFIEPKFLLVAGSATAYIMEFSDITVDVVL